MSLAPHFGFFELIVVAVIALIVVGPKDLPKLLRSVGRLVGQARRMASDFTAAFNQMARESEIEEMRAEIDAIRRQNVLADAKSALSEAKGEIDTALRPISDAVRPVEEALNEEAAQLRDAGRSPAKKSGAPVEEPYL